MPLVVSRRQPARMTVVLRKSITLQVDAGHVADLVYGLPAVKSVCNVSLRGVACVGSSASTILATLTTSRLQSWNVDFSRPVIFTLYCHCWCNCEFVKKSMDCAVGDTLGPEVDQTEHGRT